MLIKVIANAKKEQISRLANGIIKVKVSQPPEKGKANCRAIELLADFFKVKSRNIRIRKGQTRQLKEIEIVNQGNEKNKK